MDWSFLDRDDGQLGAPADWLKKQIRMYEKWKDELHAEMLEDLKRMDRAGSLLQSLLFEF